MTLRIASNALASVETPSLVVYLWCIVVLACRHGFVPWGAYIPPITDQSMHPTLRRAGMQLLAGWDIWSGYHLLAASPEADRFLRAFAARRLAASAEAA